MLESHHYVGHLHTGIVDVVLHLDARARRAQHTHECVTQRGITQVPYVGGLVGIDIGMLDDDLLAGARNRGSFRLRREEGYTICSAVEPDIDIAVAGHLHGGDARDRPDLADQFGGDFFRRLAQLLGQLEGDRYSHLPEVALPRLLGGYGQVNAIADLNM